MFNKSYDWTWTLLWVSICLTLLILGWSVLFASYLCSLTIVAVLLALFVIMGYIQYARVLALKRKFMIAQETFITIALVYFAFCHFSEQNQISSDNFLKKMRQKIDSIYALSRDYFSMPLLVDVLKTVLQIKEIQGVAKNEIKKLASTDGDSIENSQELVLKITELFQKIKQLLNIIKQGFSLNTTNHRAISKRSSRANDKDNAQLTHNPKRVKTTKMSKTTKNVKKTRRHKNNEKKS